MLRKSAEVLNTSTLVSAALRVGSVPHQALPKVLASTQVCGCAETLDESPAAFR